MLCATFSCSKLDISPMLLGNGPIIRFRLKSSTVKFFSFPISRGKHDERPLFLRISSCRFLVILPKLIGTHPSSLLLAITRTETGESPILSGSDEENLLLFRRIASNSFSNSLFGSLPSNSLYRMSRYFRVGNSRRRSGNLPEKWLLLRSISKSNFKFKKLCGIVPQKRFEFT